MKRTYQASKVRRARTHGFLVESHKLELYGRCARCRSAQEASP